MESHLSQRKKEHLLLPTLPLMAGISFQSPSIPCVINYHHLLARSLSPSLSLLLFELCGLLFWEIGEELKILTERMS